MSHRPMSRAFFAGAFCLTLATLPGPAPADVYFETTYLPTGSVVGMSPSLLPTTYVVPTAYSSNYYPTSYFPTSSVIASDAVVSPTSTTVIRRSRFRPRRYVERTYYSYPLTSTSSYASPTTYLSTSGLLPTTYLSASSLLPTTYVSRSYVSPTSYVIDDGVIATSASSSSYPCETTSSGPVKATASRPMSNNGGDSGTTITSSPSNGGMGNERRPQATVNSASAADESPASPVTSQAPREIPAPATVPTAKPEKTPPTPQPLEEPKPEDLKMPLPGESGKAEPKAGEISYIRSVRRPAYEGRNILRGRVISAESRQSEEGVTVIISNVTRSYGDRPAMTDADGEFKVSLPDGDWTVKVKMPSGSVYPVGRDYVTASGGRVTDSSGRNVTQFLITR